MIDKVKCDNKIGCDLHKYLIALLKKAQQGTECFPETISENYYKEVKNNPEKFEEWLVGLVGFCSFGGKWFGGYPRGFKNDGVTPRDIPNETIRNLKKQASNLKGVKFYNCDFRDIDTEKVKNFVVYCDPPYKGTTRYATDKFPYEEFYNWCRKISKNNIVLISEYSMPDDFECIYEKELKCTLKVKERSVKTEKLFILRDSIK